MRSGVDFVLMENREEESTDGSGSGSCGTVKKSRSLDLKSLYKTSAPEAIQDTNLVEPEVRIRKKKKRNGTASLSGAANEVKKRPKKSLDEKGVVVAGKKVSGNSNNSSNGVPISLDENGNGFKIPKRPRGTMARKKPQSVEKLHVGVNRDKGDDEADKDSVVKCEPNLDDPVVELVNGGSTTLRTEAEGGYLEEDKSRNVNSFRHEKERDGGLLESNSNASPKKCRSDYRKRKDVGGNSEASASGTPRKKVEPSEEGTAHNTGDDSQDDEDDGDLEQNAARMLSSRFDPSCTGFSSRRSSFGSQAANGFSFLGYCGPGSVTREATAVIGLEASVGIDDRVLRPRAQNKEKNGGSRKRRHFYEIRPRDLDPEWVLNRRIKVYWPLDESWYYGLVSGYDPDTKLHHVKYDDRDEEWINLQNERFKLLLLPGEVPRKGKSKAVPRGDGVESGEEVDIITDEDNYTGNCLDSEPIISWLARSSHRVKSSTSRPSKKRKTQISSSRPPLLPDVSKDVTLGEGHVRNSIAEKTIDYRRIRKSGPNTLSSSRDGKPVVYVRRRFRKRDDGSSSDRACESALRTPVVDGLSTQKEYENHLKFLSFDKPYWLISLIASEQFSFRICVPLLPFMGTSLIDKQFQLVCTVFLLQYGTIMTKYPGVILEVLCVDNITGLRFFAFEGCLKQMIVFVFFILSVFNQPDDGWKFDELQSPATSIRFKFSSVQDRRKQQVFAFYVFSNLKLSKWLHLDCKLQRHSQICKQLPLSECTYDNIKAIDGGRLQLISPFVQSELSSLEGTQRRSACGNLPVAGSKPYSTKMRQLVCNSSAKLGKPPSFAAAPTFFVSLHLKLLMERTDACNGLRHEEVPCSNIDLEVPIQQRIDGTSQMVSCSETFLEASPESNMETSLKETASSGNISCAEPLSGTEIIPENDVSSDPKLTADLRGGTLNVTETSDLLKDLEKNAIDVVVQSHVHSHKYETYNQEFEHSVASPHPFSGAGFVSGLSDAGHISRFGGMHVEIPPFDHVDGPLTNGRTHFSRQVSDLSWNVNDGRNHSPNPTGPRTSWHRSRSNLNSSPFGDISPMWSDGRTSFIQNGFGNGPRKPRTQVHYTLPSGGYDINSKHKIQNQKGFSFKRIRKASEKRITDSSRSSRRNLELLACDANVLVTVGDKGWRECGARVVLEVADHNEWRLAVKLSGSTKYSCKVHNVLQPGSTNRFTHAMMWKGGKDWSLEFPDRSQWILFKEMHEECYNRNIRAASVKNIPIPGVRLIEEGDDCSSEFPFIRNPSKYIRQVESDVDMAMNPSHILYDMDSEDEQWFSQNKSSLCTEGNNFDEISEYFFEKTMDMLEKASYVQQRDQFSFDEVKELLAGVGSMRVVKAIYEHWRQKRLSKGIPLIRQFQPPLWERYQQQLKEWEQAVAKTHVASGNHQKVAQTEKPPMFAFCLKPRGLEVPNRGSKQRAQKRYSVSGHNHVFVGDHDGLHAFGRRLNGYSYGDEKVALPGNSHDSSDASPSLQASARVFSPRGASGVGYFSLTGDVSEWSHRPRFQRNKAKKKIGTFRSTNSNSTMVASYNQGTVGNKNNIHKWNVGLPEWQSQKHFQSEVSSRHGLQQLDGSDLHEFRLRDASGAAQHARNMAKLKRERAQRLLYRADLAIHKAVVAIMTAEAMKAASENSTDDIGSNQCDK